MHPLERKDVKVSLRTADQTRRAELDMDRGQSAGELIQSAVDHWALPTDTDYTLVNVTTGRVIAPRQVLDEDAVGDGDLLEVQPVLVAGARA
jgi:hypothetical protein